MSFFPQDPSGFTAYTAQFKSGADVKNLVVHVNEKARQAGLTYQKISQILPTLLSQMRSHGNWFSLDVIDFDKSQDSIITESQTIQLEVSPSNFIQVQNLKKLRVRKLRILEKGSKELLSPSSKGWFDWMRWSQKSSQATLADLANRQFMKGPEGFCLLLGIFANEIGAQIQFEDEAIPLKQLEGEFSKCAEEGLKIQKALSSQNLKLLQQLVDQVVMQLKDEEASITLPLGYYSDAGYCPLLMNLSKKNELIHVHLIGIDLEDDTKLLPSYIYTFSDKNLDTFKETLFLLYQFQLKPDDHPPPEEKSAMLSALKMLSTLGTGTSTKLRELEAKKEALEEIQKYLADHTINDLITEAKLDEAKRWCELSLQKAPYAPALVRNKTLDLIEQLSSRLKQVSEEINTAKHALDQSSGESSYGKRSSLQVIDALLQEAGCVPSREKNKTRAFRQGSTWSKIVYKFAERRFADFATVHLLSFETNYVFNYLDLLLSECEKSQQYTEEVEQRLMAAEQLLVNLEKRYRKEYGDPNALYHVWQPYLDRYPLLKKVKERILEVKVSLSLHHYQKLSTLLVHSSWETCLSQKDSVDTKMQTRTVVIAKAHENLDLLETFLVRFANETASDARQKLIDGITSEWRLCLSLLEKYSEAQDYKPLLILSSALMHLLPPPADPKMATPLSNFWEEIPVEQELFWCKAISSLMQHQWESCLKLNIQQITPSDVVNLITSQSILHKLLKKAVFRAKLNFIAKFKSLEPSVKLAKMSEWKVADFNHFMDVVEKGQLIDFNLEFIRKYSLLIGYVAKHTGIAREEALLLFYEGYSVDHHQISHLIDHHPTFFYGRSPQADEKLDLIKHYYLSGSEGEGIPLSLDSWRHYHSMHYGNKNFLDSVSQFLKGFENADPTQLNQAVVAHSIWKSSWNPEELTPMDYLPLQGIYIRRAQVFMQVLLHPESTVFKGFSNGLKKTQWALSMASEVIATEEDFDSRMRLAAKKQRAKLSRELSEMGRLDIFVSQDPEFTSSPGIQFADKNKTHLIAYMPAGPNFYDYRDPLFHQVALGQKNRIPTQFLTSSTSDRDRPLSKKSNAEKKREQETKTPLTEARMLIEEQSQPSTSIDPAINHKLRSLIVEKAGKVSALTFYNVMDFIFQYPNLLEQEAIQRILERALFKTSVIQTALEENPGYLVQNQLGQKLSASIEFARTNERLLAATFLISISTLLKQHMHFCLQKTPTHPFLEQAIPTIPSFEAGYLSAVQKWALSSKTSEAHKKFIFTYLLEYYQTCQKPQTFKPQDFHIILVGYGYLKNIASDHGFPGLQKTLIHWVELIVLPYFEEKYEDKTSVLSLYVQDQKNCPWTNKGDYVYYNETTKATVHLFNGTTSTQNQSEVRITTTLPDEVLNHPIFTKLFGPYQPAVSILNSDSPTSTKYYFKEEQKEFIITFDASSQEIQVFHKIQFKNETPTWCLYSAVDPKKGVEREALVERFGVWLSVAQSNRAFIILGPVLTWTEKDLLKFKTKSVGRSQIKLERGRTADRKTVYKDSTNFLVSIFGFAALEDTLFITSQAPDKKNQSLTEVSFLSKGFSLVKQPDNTWLGKGELQDSTLVKDTAALQHIIHYFGPDFHKMLLPMERLKKGGYNRQIDCVVFPVRLQRNAIKESFLSDLSSDPASAVGQELSTFIVQLEFSLFDPDDHGLKTTAAGFLYLAYFSYVNRDYEKAIQYLEDACKSNFKPTELQAFNQVISYVRERADLSLRGIAFRLKFELYLRKMESEQLGLKEFRPHQWKNYVEQLREEIKLFKLYQDKILSDSKKNLLANALLLRPHEVTQFQQMIRKSFEFLVEILPEKSTQSTYAPFFIQKLSEESLHDFAVELTKYMQAPDPRIRLEDLFIYTTKHELLQNFWSYAAQIWNEELLPTDWRIQKLKSLIARDQDEQSKRTLQIAQQLLIQLSKMHQNLVPVLEKALTYCVSSNNPELLKEFATFQSLTHKGEPIIRLQPGQIEEARQFSPSSRSSSLSTFGAWAKMAVSFALKKKSLVPGHIEQRTKDSLSMIFLINKFLTQFDGADPKPVCEEAPAEDPFETTLAYLQAFLNKEADSPFSPGEKQLWSTLVEKLAGSHSQNERLDILILLSSFLQKGISLPSLRYETELCRELQILKQTKPSTFAKSSLSPQANRVNAQSVSQAEQFSKELIAEGFGLENWKPSQAQIAKEMDCFTALNHWRAKEFSTKFNEIRISHDKRFLKILAEQCKSHTLSAGYWKPRLLSLTLCWFLYVATQIRLKELNVNPDGPSVLLPILVFENGICLPRAYKVHDCPALLEALEEVYASHLDIPGVIKLQDYKKAIEDTFARVTEDPMEEAENERILEAKRDYEFSKTSKELVVRTHAVYETSEKIQARLQVLLELVKVQRKSLLTYLLENPDFFPKLRKTLLNSQIYGSKAICEKMLDLYQTLKLRTVSQIKEQDLNAFESSITAYLYDMTEIQQLEQALQSLDSLTNLLSQSRGAEWDSKWEESSKRLFTLLGKVGSRRRYLDPTGSFLIDPIFGRKHLVAEYRSQLIAHSYQPQVVEKMVNSKNCLLLLRPGAGKSKWIIPEVAHLLAQVHQHFPIILVPDELFQINKLDMDKSTRELFRQAGHAFSFSRYTPKDNSYLMEECKRLLQVKNSQDYLITTVSQLAALDDEIVLVTDQLATQFNVLMRGFEGTNAMRLLENQEIVQSLQELNATRQRRYWLLKVREVIHSPESHYIADEVQKDFDVTLDFNYTLGKAEAPNVDICITAHHLFQTLMESKDLLIFQNKLLKNEQSTLNGKVQGADQELIPQIQPYLENLATAIYDQKTPFGLSEEAWKQTKLELGMTRQEFVRFMLGKEVKANSLNLDREYVQNSGLKYVAAAKHLLSITLPFALLQKAELDFGLGNDGCTVVPKKDGMELPGVRFGDEYELVTYSYLYYISKCCSQEYFEDQWSQIEDQIATERQSGNQIDSEVKKLLAKVPSFGQSRQEKMKELYEVFKRAEMWKLRLRFLRDDILKNHVKVFREQIKCNAQDPIFDAQVTGVSGTMNAYALPEFFNPDSSVYSRDVAVDTYIKLAAMSPSRLEQKVEVYSDSIQHLLNLVKQDTCPFIIDQAGATEGMKARDVIKLFREKGKWRQYCFVDSITQQQMIWNPEDPEPQSADPSKLRADRLIYFSPSSIVGTDWPIPSGEGHFLVGPTMTDELFLQGIKRARQLGEGQNVKIHIHTSMQESYNLAHQLDPHNPMTLSKLLDAIKKRTLDLKAQLNLKASIHKLRSIIPQYLKKVLYRLPPEINLDMNFKNPAEVLATLNDIAVDVKFFQVARGYFIHRKQVDFTSDLETNKLCSTLTYLQDLYEKELSKSKALLQKIAGIKSEMQRSFSFAFGQISPQSAQRLAFMEDKLQLLPSQIGHKKALFEKSKDQHMKNLKPYIATGSFTESSDSHEQVQEQEQEQQQQLTLVSDNATCTTFPPKLLDRPTMEWMNWPEKLASDSRSVLETLTLSADAKQLDKRYFDTVSGLIWMDCGFDSSIWTTLNFKQLYQEQKRREGAFLGRIAVIKGQQTDSVIFMLIDQLDFDRGFAPELKHVKTDTNCTMSVSIHSFINSPICNDILLNCVDSTPKRVLKEPKHLGLLAQIKVLAGILSFSDPEEKAALQSWLHSLKDEQKQNLKKFLASCFGVNIAAQIPGWENSDLKIIDQ